MRGRLSTGSRVRAVLSCPVRARVAVYRLQCASGHVCVGGRVRRPSFVGGYARVGARGRQYDISRGPA